MYPPSPRRSEQSRHGFAKVLLLIVGAVIIVIGALIWQWNHQDDTLDWGKPSAASNSNGSSASDSVPSDFDKTKYPIDDPKSIWVVVNKDRSLNPKDFAPQVVVPDVPLKGSPSAENMHVAVTMAPHLKTLFDAAAAAGYHLRLSSGYRSFRYQIVVYDREVHSVGQTKADQESARPGHSEHQTGLAADVGPVSGKCDLSQCFGATPEGQWLAANAWRYGFIIRYPKGKESITGYEYEPWHVRYVGTDLSTEMHKTGISTLEEFFGLPAAPGYNN